MDACPTGSAWALVLGQLTSVRGWETLRARVAGNDLRDGRAAPESMGYGTFDERGGFQSRRSVP